MASLKIVSPVDGRIYAERPLAGASEITAALAAARKAQAAWREVSIADRGALCARFVDAMVARKDEFGKELSWQMGRPVRYTPNEIAGGLQERTRQMVALAPEALADVKTVPKAGFTRFIRRDPLGVVFVVAPWNYPYLTAVNAIVPATSGVCAECFRITALPARIAGTMAFTAVRYG